MIKTKLLLTWKLTKSLLKSRVPMQARSPNFMFKLGKILMSENLSSISMPTQRNLQDLHQLLNLLKKNSSLNPKKRNLNHKKNKNLKKRHPNQKSRRKKRSLKNSNNQRNNNQSPLLQVLKESRQENLFQD